jgi:hypothetical protein
MDLVNPKWMYLKAVLFVLIGCCCFTLAIVDNPSLKNALLLILMVWAFSRAYYFAFYVIEKYIDAEYKFSGLISFLRYIIKK